MTTSLSPSTAGAAAASTAEAMRRFEIQVEVSVLAAKVFFIFTFHQFGITECQELERQQIKRCFGEFFRRGGEVDSKPNAARTAKLQNSCKLPIYFI